jgi:hypothetical protein
MSPQKIHQAKDKHRINVILTAAQFERLKWYAEEREITFSEAVRELIKAIPMKKQKSID